MNKREIKEFDKLGLADKGMLILNEGKHLAQVSKDNYLINLYLFRDIFIEVYYSMGLHQISNISIVHDISRVDFYIDEKKNV